MPPGDVPPRGFCFPGGAPPGGVSPGDVPPGGVLPGGVPSRGCVLPGGLPPGDVCFQGVCLQGGVWQVCQHALRQTPPVNRITDTSKNITLATTSLWLVMKFLASVVQKL